MRYRRRRRFGRARRRRGRRRGFRLRIGTRM